jgi:hypothetical protein
MPFLDARHPQVLSVASRHADRRVSRPQRTARIPDQAAAILFRTTATLAGVNQHAIRCTARGESWSSMPGDVAAVSPDRPEEPWPQKTPRVFRSSAGNDCSSHPAPRAARCWSLSQAGRPACCISAAGAVTRCGASPSPGSTNTGSKRLVPMRSPRRRPSNVSRCVCRRRKRTAQNVAGISESSPPASSRILPGSGWRASSGRRTIR